MPPPGNPSPECDADSNGMSTKADSSGIFIKADTSGIPIKADASGISIKASNGKDPTRPEGVPDLVVDGRVLTEQQHEATVSLAPP